MAPHRVDSIWSARYVVTMDAQRRVIENGAVAIVRRSHRRRRHARRDRPGLAAEAAPRPAGRDSRAGPDQHPHARGHVAVPRHRRRHEAAGLAGEVHLSRRGQERRPRVRALGHAAGLPRDGAFRHHHLHGHVLFRGHGGRGDQGGRPARRAGRDRHRLSRAGLQDAASSAGRHGKISSRRTPTIR